ncbi:unnamed protein product [Linum trigynum]|uniref:Uncharacterized protein n=1 Tax=Linum trigynum TaxID=586398 RepID=A0AAV2G1J9_9ROSI
MALTRGTVDKRLQQVMEFMDATVHKETYLEDSVAAHGSRGGNWIGFVDWIGGSMDQMDWIQWIGGFMDWIKWIGGLIHESK